MDWGEEILKHYGEEEYDKEDMNLIQKSFWSGIRSQVYKEVIHSKDGYHQWQYISGRKSRYPNGERIRLSNNSLKILQNIVDYLESDEGRMRLDNLDITKPPEHVDDLVQLIEEAPTDRVLKREQFRLFMKHKYAIMKFLPH